MNEFCVLDIETSDKYPAKGAIVEIGIVLVNVEKGTGTILFDKVVKDDSTFHVTGQHKYNRILRDAWIFHNTDLIYDIVMNAPFLSKFYDRLQKLFNMFYFTGFNVSFDFSFFEYAHYVIPYKLPDLMRVLTPVMKLPPFAGKKEFKYPTFQQAWRWFFPDSPYIEKHRAGDDALRESKVALEMVKQGMI